jgi:hypothetical protein
MNNSKKIKTNSKTKTKTKTKKIVHNGGVNWPAGIRRKLELKNQEEEKEKEKNLNQPTQPHIEPKAKDEFIMTIEEEPRENDEFIMTIEEEPEKKDREESLSNDISSDIISNKEEEEEKYDYKDDVEHKEDYDQEEKQPEPTTPKISQAMLPTPVISVSKLKLTSVLDKLDQLTRAKRMAFRLFNFKERIVNTKQIKVKYDKLIQIVEKNTPVNINKNKLIEMINGIYSFTKIMVQMLLDVKVDINQSLILDTQTFATHKDFINKLFDSYLVYETQFLEYKNLSVNESTIKLVPPKIDRSTQKYIDRIKMCKNLSVNNKNIELYSEFPKQNVTRKNRGNPKMDEKRERK